MAPLVLEGDTLGQKHRHYNSLLKAAVGDLVREPEEVEEGVDDGDTANLLRVDVACARRDVPSVLRALCSPDLLIAARAARRSAWLITDPQYAHIVNPEYLERELFPSMTAKAKSKFIFAIRQNLKDEARVDAFFHYYETNPQTAIKWLPGCSIATIEKMVEKFAQHLKYANQIERLCRKSFSILKIYCDQDSYYKKNVLQKVTHFISSHCNEYLDDNIKDIVDSLPHYCKPVFKKNATQAIMNNCRERVMSNFDKYCRILHTKTFAENMKPEEVQDFLVKQKQKAEMKLWVKFDNVRHFLKHIPKDSRVQFIKSMFLDQPNAQGGDDEIMEEFEFSTNYAGLVVPMGRYSRAIKSSCKMSRPAVSNAHIYRWYRYLPFNTALTELKKLIYVEPLPAERNAILTVLIKCAQSNQQNLKALLAYYRNNHVNEPFNFKVQFVNSFLSHAKTHDFDYETWNLLNNIFSSMEVYMESENKVPFCINAIIVYKVLCDQDIPEIIEKKFTFSTLKNYRSKLNETQQTKVFNYLYSYLVKTLESQKIAYETDMARTIDTLCNMLSLLVDWNKNIMNYPVVMKKIKNIIQLKRENSWTMDLSNLYNAAKSWRRHLFEESLVLHPSEEACLNALKHDPKLLSRYESEVKMLCSNVTYPMNRLLRKIRLYWSDSIAQQWADLYFTRIEQAKGRQAIKYICILMPQNKILPFIKYNAPIESKIDWNNAMETKLNLRKNIAKYMHLVRPSVGLDTVLLYAKGDYLYYAMPSINAVLYNMSSNATSKNISKLLDAPVSLQKHGICTIFRKLKYNDIKEVVTNLWKNTKNSTIKTILFQQTFKLLCNEKNEAIINDLWHLFSMYIDSLSPEENAVIYHTFAKFKNVPLTVRPKFFMKSYKYLKSVSAKNSADKIIGSLFCEVTELVMLLEPSFVENVLLENISDKFIKKSDNDLRTHFDILTLYILCCKTGENQMLRYENVLLPLMQNAFASWKLRAKGKYYIRKRLLDLLQAFITNLSRVNPSEPNYMPTKLFQTVYGVLNTSLPTEENFEILMSWGFASLFVVIVDEYTKKNPQMLKEKEKLVKDASQTPIPYGNMNDGTKLWESICTDVAAPFGEACAKKLKQDYFFCQYPTLHSCVREILRDLLSNLGFSDEIKMKFLKAMLADKDATTIYCMVIDLMDFLYDSKEVKALKKEVLNILRLNTATDVRVNVSFYENTGLWSEDEDGEQNKNE